MRRERRLALGQTQPIGKGYKEPLKTPSSHPAAVRSRVFREKHPGYNEERQRRWREKYPDRVEARALKCKEERRQDPRKTLWKSAKQRAKERNMPFTITMEDITIPDVCPVLGIKLKVSPGNRCDNSPSLDRIDSKKGYTPSNVVVVSWRVNDIKKDATLTELRRIVNFYER